MGTTWIVPARARRGWWSARARCRGPTGGGRWRLVREPGARPASLGRGSRRGRVGRILARPADPAPDGGHTVEQRDQLGDVVAVAAGDRERERDPGGVDQEMMLRSGSAPANRARARFGAPLFACTWRPSATARYHSISPAACNRANGSACSLSHTPAACHSSSRRRHVAPDPNPSSSGRCRHAIPVDSTNKIPCSVSRSPSRLRPGYRNRPRRLRQQRLDQLPQPVRHTPWFASNHLSLWPCQRTGRSLRKVRPFLCRRGSRQPSGRVR